MYFAFWNRFGIEQNLYNIRLWLEHIYVSKLTQSDDKTVNLIL